MSDFEWTPNLTWALVAVGALVTIAVVSIMGRSSRHSEARDMVRAAADWAATSEQDANPVAAVAHSAYAAAYLDAARKLDSIHNIESACGVDYEELRQTIRGVQARSLNSLRRACPAVAGLVQSKASIFAASV
jgi:hypothetical protein